MNPSVTKGHGGNSKEPQHEAQGQAPNASALGLTRHSSGPASPSAEFQR
jgi:hypothetical protein